MRLTRILYAIVTVIVAGSMFIGGLAEWRDSDMEEDRRMRAKTIPVQWGVKAANAIIMLTIILTLCMNVVIFY